MVVAQGYMERMGRSYSKGINLYKASKVSVTQEE